MSGEGTAPRTHSTRSCLSPAKSFLCMRVMLLPLSSLGEERRKGTGETGGWAPGPGLSSRLCLKPKWAGCFPAKLQDPQACVEAQQAGASLQQTSNQQECKGHGSLLRVPQNRLMALALDEFHLVEETRYSHRKEFGN